MTEPKKFLIIDDDPDFVEGIMSILVSAGYEVEAKYNPKEGYKALETGKYDLLLLDIMMGRGAEGVILGCTETPLLVGGEDAGMPLFDTTVIHAEAALNYALG